MPTTTHLTLTSLRRRGASGSKPTPCQRSVSLTCRCDAIIWPSFASFEFDFEATTCGRRAEVTVYVAASNRGYLTAHHPVPTTTHRSKWARWCNGHSNTTPSQTHGRRPSFRAPAAVMMSNAQVTQEVREVREVHQTAERTEAWEEFLRDEIGMGRKEIPNVAKALRDRGIYTFKQLLRLSEDDCIAIGAGA